MTQKLSKYNEIIYENMNVKYLCFGYILKIVLFL